MSLHGFRPAILNCLWVPSPQSIRIFSASHSRKIDGWLLFEVGKALLVPRNVRLMFICKLSDCGLNRFRLLFNLCIFIYKEV